MIDKVTIGNATLYRGDCRDIMPTLPKFDLVLTDPPYGINAARTRNSRKDGWVDYGCDGWDQERPEKSIFDLIVQAADIQIIWGGNYFSDYLPASQQWLSWDKGQDGFSLADFELAWTSQDRACRRINYPRSLALKDGKQHPTQKPVAVMAWCLSHVHEPYRTVLDPFMGSGTTGVACAQMGKAFTGIEREPKYFDIACRRIEAAQAQGQLIPHEQPKPEQADLLTATDDGKAS